MGLIREIREITATMDRKERAKREREHKKILLENYNQEILGNLKACYFQAFKSYLPEEAERLLLEQKEQNIAKIVKEIENITHTENNKTYYTYRNLFDIYTDVSSKYYTELQKFKKEYYQLEKLQKVAEQQQQKDKQAEYTIILYNKLLQYYIENKNNLLAASRTLHKFENVEIIISDITQDNDAKQFLFNDYIAILSKIEKLFKYELQQEKTQQKQFERMQKIKKANKIKRDIATIYIFKKINKILKSNRKKRH